MARVLKPVLVGGAWGVGLGVAIAGATVLAPGLRSLAERAARQWSDLGDRARGGAMGMAGALEDIYQEGKADAGS